jgi:hypothetical protein
MSDPVSLEDMILFLYDRMYPPGKMGRRIGAKQFLEGLRAQPPRIIEDMYITAKKEKERRSYLAKIRSGL